MMTRIAIRKKIICLLATYLHQKPKLLSRPQEVEEIKEKEDEVSSDVPIHTIVMPIRITFDNPIDFNDHFSKPKDFKKDLTVLFDSSESSILPSPLLDSDSPFTAELSASVTLNSLRNEDKVFKPGILVYHAIHDKNLVTLEENLKENISSGTLLVFKEPSFLLPPPKPPDECLNFEPILVMKNVVLNGDFYQSKKTLPLNVEDVNSFTFIIWTFLPHFTYTEESPLIFSFRSENFVFDPGIITFHNPVEQQQVHVVCAWVLDLYYGDHGFDSFTGGTAQEYESTAGANLSTAEVYESTAHSLFKVRSASELRLQERCYTLVLILSGMLSQIYELTNLCVDVFEYHFQVLRMSSKVGYALAGSEGKTSPSTLIGGDPRKNDTVDMKEAQGNRAYTFEVHSKEAQRLLTHGCHAGNPCALQSNPTAHI
ncbi:hypothetical protein Tco_0471121 [Tanacetum coccineum]